MKNILALIGLLVIIGGGIFWYLSRPVAVPSNSENPHPLPTSTNGTIYHIYPEDSEVKFSIGEVLRGSPFTAIGTTKDVSGDISLDGSTITFGTLSVNARTLKTDSTQRDGTIARLILKSEKPENEFITFLPTGFNRLPNQLPTNTEFSFQLLGDLTISGITKPATFDITMIILDNAAGKRLMGVATTTVKRSDFNLTIPNIPFVASVDETFPVTATIAARLTQ